MAGGQVEGWWLVGPAHDHDLDGGGQCIGITPAGDLLSGIGAYDQE